MKLKAFGVVLAGLIFFGIMAYLPYKSDIEVEYEARNRLVRINTIKGDDVFGCSGTLLSHNFILTNDHCFPDGYTQIVIRRFNENEYRPAKIVAAAKKTDFALLKFDGIDTSTPVQFSKNWVLGEEIVLYGNPGIQDFVLGHSRIVGYVYVMTPLKKLRPMIVYPCNESAPGFSGSAIYNLRGEYLGTDELGQEVPFVNAVISKLVGQEVMGPLCFAIPAKESIERNLDRPWLGFNLKEK